MRAQSNSRDNRFCVGGQVECRVVIGFDTLYRVVAKYGLAKYSLIIGLGDSKFE